MQIDWKKHPLVPCVVQDYENSEVLMLAYMNEEALKLTQSSKVAHYFSRSKDRIWKKGESSGNLQHVKEMWLDCDSDTILIKVLQVGSACHTGARSCFFTSLDSNKESKSEFSETKYPVLLKLYYELVSKKSADPKLSYTASLYAKAPNAIAKKVIEEAGEFALALKDSDEKEVVHECADLFYHILVGLAYKDIHLDKIDQELSARMGLSGLEEKRQRKS
ncbi:bifunctional phosphoribosyl-AMP cyclohydrolase/phosphoribosyl-ATP diphosphatase HisIE [Helicobacter sp. 11S02629-2]|uniref:bifunctional phosphoribosyl-AMP cyclohydrolase/phosphoribosyl-ATP diphosphatase HisIE n=1 Tax=Helicobacter sp. 11S02629-2 TaxID=1476195 RepID=UPI000BA68470|nr:bifunctional phosphoribosyl-AMP cyclohydrolase/phosphoribosyl-ATP diphosphatase HisIE [Helicobacter sp. 11S02629-2]PAF43282.1 bifunctional phosphoribosyl-AMP cyclohydrolase/phosphoribosyl-ATP pyrophosphatase [Helicobacter sp. 11S02629-2]